MDYDIYTSEMAKSVWDKAFFMDKIPGVKCVIDFGCADGAMIRYLSGLFPNILFVGYDISPDLIHRARLTPPFNANLIYFCGAMGEGTHNVYDYVSAKFKPDEICINFSSVLHEVFSSTGGTSEIQFIIKALNPKYITIRDMYFDYDKRIVKRSLAQNIIDRLKIDESYIQQFEEKHDTILIWKNLIHFLMKYQWKDNGWEQELQENYFSWQLNDFLALTNDNYIPVFETHYQLPYYTESWKELFNIPEIHTHAQFILRRND